MNHPVTCCSRRCFACVSYGFVYDSDLRLIRLPSTEKNGLHWNWFKGSFCISSHRVKIINFPVKSELSALLIDRRGKAFVPVVSVI